MYVTSPAKHQPTKPIFVVDPAVAHCELDAFNGIMRRAPQGSTFRYFAPALFGLEELFETAETPSAIIIFGSSASVYDALPWQEKFHQWVLEQVTAKIPTLGLCYGHQLLAALFGGEVDLGFEGEKKRGFRSFEISPNCRLPLRNFRGACVVSHKEVVIDCGLLNNIATSDSVVCEGLEHPWLPAWGFQAHVEATPGFLRNRNMPPARSPTDFAFGHEVVDAFLKYALKPAGSNET